MERRRLGILLPVAATLTMAGCSLQSSQAPVDATPGFEAARPDALEPAHVEIVNDPAALESRVTRSARALTVAPRSTTAQVAEKPHSEQALGVRLTLVAEVAPPVVEGRVVQANDIEIHGNKAIVAFNYAGEVFAGAVQVIDITHATRPELVSEVRYARADVNSVALQGNQVFAGLSVDDPALPTPAVVEELMLSTGLERTSNWRQMPSWAVTDLLVHGDVLVACVGARDGGLVSMRRSGLLLSGFAPATDPRSVALGGSGVMSVCGAPGRMLDYRMDGLTLVKSTPIPGYAQEGAKGTIEWSSSRCYLASGDAGLQVRDQGGDMLAQLGNSEFANRVAQGVVNAFTVTNHLGFVAAGPAGVQVVRLGRYRCDGREAEDDTGLLVMGELELEDGASCNMVRARNDVLVVAGGAGGVKLVTMEFIN